MSSSGRKSGRSGRTFQQLVAHRFEIEAFEKRLLLSAQLVADVNQSPASSSPAKFISSGNLAYFIANDGSNGAEFWRTDGTVDGTHITKDLLPGGGGSAVATSTISLVNFNGTVFFNASLPNVGLELCKSDGTEAGTQLVKDIRPGTTDGSINLLTVANGLLFFVANDGVTGAELWCTDGSTDGTRLVKEIRIGSDGGHIVEMAGTADRLYFSADDGVNGSVLWTSDGTAAGTVPFKLAGSGAFLKSPGQFGVVGNRVFFNANGSDGSGMRTWVSDGTQQGTKDVGVTSVPSAIAMGGIAYYRSDLPKLVRSDGTAQGTSIIFDASSVPEMFFQRITDPVRAGNFLYFMASTSSGVPYLYRSDGTTAGTVPVEQTPRFTDTHNPFLSTAAVGNLAFFTVQRNGNDANAELWRTDGTQAGTLLIRTLDPFKIGVGQQPFAVAGNSLFFGAPDPISGYELWKSDGTVAGTMQVKDINAATAAAFTSTVQPTDAGNGNVVFGVVNTTSNSQLMVTQGSPATTSLLQDLMPAGGSIPRNFVRFDNAVYFISNTGFNSIGLWKTQGTPQSTSMLAAVGGGNGSLLGPDVFAIAGDSLFLLTNGNPQLALYKTDGTPQGTKQIKTFITSNQNPSMASLNGRVLFRAPTGNSIDYELWSSDGTPEGTARLKDINVGTASSSPSGLFTFNGNVYFSANDGTHGIELWKSDGTETGTTLFADINPGTASSSPVPLAVFGGLLLYTADDGSGKELWRTDGTPKGTFRLADIYQGSTGSSPVALGTFGNRWYFSADDGIHGRELWSTDGSTPGTRLVKDINPGLADSLDSGPGVAFGGGLVFAARDLEHGTELWRTDGTAEGTKLLADVWPGPNHSTPVGLSVIGDHLYFGANDGVVGLELFRIADEIPPSAVDFSWTPAKTLRIQFNEDVSASLSTADILVRNAATQVAISPSSLAYVSASNTATFTFNTPLPDGNYSVEFQSAGISDLAGNLFAAGAVAPTFFVLHGDADGDRAVGFADLVAVAQHYGQTGLTWKDGDFNDDGAVDFADLVVLAQAYGTQLSPPGVSAAPAALPAAKSAPKPVSVASKFGTRPIVPVKPVKVQIPLKVGKLKVK